MQKETAMNDPLIDDGSEFGTALRDDHASLFGALEDLLFFGEAGTPALLQCAWQAFEAALHGHLTTEEEILLPPFELERPEDAARIRGEHHEIREQLTELEDELCRGALDRERVARLLGLLRVSAGFKEKGLYPWAEELPALIPSPRGLERTFASGRTGSLHPISAAPADTGHTLSTGCPQQAQQNSLAEPNPHGDSKLSSARGTTQEREHETLAEGHPRR
jgi:hypothetical protein